MFIDTAHADTAEPDEIKFSGTQADEIRKQAVIKLLRRRRHMLALVIALPLLMIFYCFGSIIHAGITDGVEPELKKELWLDPDRIESYYDVYVRSEWYASTVSGSDIDPYDIKNNVFRWSMITGAFEAQFGFDATYDPASVVSPTDSLEVFTQKVQATVDETRARLTEEYRWRTVLLWCLAVLLSAAFLLTVYALIFPPIIRRMKNSALIVCEGECKGFGYFNKWYRLTAVLNNDAKDVVSVRIDDSELPFGERRAFRNSEDTRVLAVRIENDTRRRPKIEVFPLASIEKIESRIYLPGKWQ